MSRPSVSHPATWLLLALVFAPLTSVPAHAQYMYLDTNGDGQSTEADVVSPTGPTVADVWLRTDQDRAGVAAVCPTQDGAMTINSYEFILRAVDGSVSWGAITNRMPFATDLGTATSGSDAHVGFGGAILPAGTYRLATVTFSTLFGTPSIEIVGTTPMSAIYATSFGSACSGNDFDNTLKLGSDWFDIDGALWGGTPNAAPVFAPIPTLVATEGQLASLPISASDPDGNTIQFQKASGPAYLTVHTIDAAAGTGRLDASPGYLDAGTGSAVISANDGFRTSLATVRIDVVDSPAPPELSTVGNMRVLAGGTADQVIYAFDADGEAGQVTFEMVTGPAFVTVGTLSVLSSSSARGQIHVAPSSLDVGTASATVAAVKGAARDEAVFQIGVLAEAPANRPCVVSDMVDVTMPNETTRSVPFSAQDPDGDVMSAHLVSGQSFASVEILTSSPGSLSGTIVLRPGSSDIGDHTITLGAYDGIAETRASFVLHVTGASAPRFTVLQDMSVGAGLSATQTIWATSSDPDATFLTFGKVSGPTYVSVQTQNSFPTYAFAEVTLRPSLSDVGTAIAEISVSDGTNTTTEPMQIEVLPACPPMLAVPIVPLDGARRSNVGDVDGDHIPDVLGFSFYTNDVIVRLGNGDGTFRDGPVLVGAGSTTASLLTDVNSDGRADLVTAGGVNAGVFVRLALGGGVFGPPLATPISGYPHDPEALAAAHMNSDGHIDLVVGEGGLSPVVRVLLGAGDGTFALAGSAGISSTLMTLATGDVDRDGREDVVVGQYYNPSLLVIHGDGAGGFGATQVYSDAGYSAHSVAIGDLNGDSWPDLVSAHDQLSVWFNDGTGSFGPAWQSQAPYRFWSVAVGDVTGDQLKDVVATGEQWFDQTLGACLVFPGVEADSLATPTGTIFDRHVIDAALANLDRNGRLDVVATGQASILAYFNQGCGPNRPPTSDPGGPYAGTVDVPISFDGSGSSDPDGSPLTYHWDFGDDGEANGARVEHAYASAGSYTVTLSVADGELTESATTTATITAALSARAFVIGDSRTTPLVLSGPPLCIQLEPEDEAFRIEDLDPASVVVRSDRVGAVEEIGVVDSKGVVKTDRDRNGVAELTACFSRADLASLLGPLQGRTQVTLEIEGTLVSGATVRATLDLEVLAVGPLSARVYPNPMNPTSRLSLTLPRPGRLRAVLFDVSGRSLRVLADEPRAEAGVREIAIDGKDDRNRPLATGIYYYRVESAGDVLTGQVVIIK